ncbi:MAG: bifunctional phosphoglucose/phosphomannose isomerase, partial [Nanoarchaeota archaeon]|nr:bifunctional phosphoglucose/phosphomannose isomerase [Nanoarchaeota archaeon]
IYKEKAKQLAERLFNKVPLIYSSERLYAIAYKWKINFNENSKIHAFCNFFPELNHNEMVGFTKKNGDYYCIIIKDDYDERRIKKRMSITKDIITINKSPALELNITGTSDLVKIFSTIHIGDWTSYILALKNKVDPTPVKLVEYLKKKL